MPLMILVACNPFMYEIFFFLKYFFCPNHKLGQASKETLLAGQRSGGLEIISNSEMHKLLHRSYMNRKYLFKKALKKLHQYKVRFASTNHWNILSQQIAVPAAHATNVSFVSLCPFPLLEKCLHNLNGSSEAPVAKQIGIHFSL